MVLLAFFFGFLGVLAMNEYTWWLIVPPWALCVLCAGVAIGT